MLTLPFATSSRSLSVALFRGGVVTLEERTIEFPLWTGRQPRSTWNGKPVVGPPSLPFAELAIADHLVKEGWASAWVYRRKAFLQSWEPRTAASLPKEALFLFKAVAARAKDRGGPWDVFAWRRGQPLFVESKWPGDRLRPSQVAWLEAALSEGVPISAFLVAACRRSEGAA